MADSPPQRLEHNPKVDRHSHAECPILSCDYGKPPGKKKLRHDIFNHLRGKHQIDLPLRGKSGGFNMAEHNKACLEHFVGWADEYDVEHEADKFFKYATQKRQTGPTKKATAQTGVAPDAPVAAYPPPPSPQAPYQPAFKANTTPGAAGVGFPAPRFSYQPAFKAGMVPGAASVGPPLPMAPNQPAQALPQSIVPVDTPWYGQGSAAPIASGLAPPLPRAPYQPASSLSAPFFPAPPVPAPPVPAPIPWYGEKREPLLYLTSTEEMDEVVEEEAEHLDDIPDDADYGSGAEGNPELSQIVLQLRAGSRSLTSTLPDFRSILDQGLHQQLIDVFVSALVERASDLRHDSAYRSLLLALLIMHASEPATKDFAQFLVEKTREYRKWLTRQTYPDTPHHLYRDYCGTYRAEDGFFDIMYGIYVDILMRTQRTQIETIPLIDFKSIVMEFGGGEEGMHARDFDVQQELLSRDCDVVYGMLLRVIYAWLKGYKQFNQAFFQHLVFELDAEDERRDRMTRGLEIE
ncbi:hypothetical protein HII31_02548 [Pseudocercospora fuligena]|uniref:Uncharacterized protein n=1 Tax=Pseudocercospora fuligena TaxID=685502 RepID=A0A8H6RSN8_9PEZI|nr:hypothetical protein HII31_02548 [Pseudocercospora fuligena]